MVDFLNFAAISLAAALCFHLFLGVKILSRVSESMMKRAGKKRTIDKLLEMTTIWQLQVGQYQLAFEEHLLGDPVLLSTEVFKSIKEADRKKWKFCCALAGELCIVEACAKKTLVPEASYSWEARQAGKPLAKTPTAHTREKNFENLKRLTGIGLDISEGNPIPVIKKVEINESKYIH